ncbi:MAG TPA: PEGA domain-containing protein, partial [Sandaracinaceae bacterium LLY-WYZ-13_1]|nr:PEGA domain-containing protein [Sandaracinaceae bacterium LLY-WYZ-13_1]
ARGGDRGGPGSEAREARGGSRSRGRAATTSSSGSEPAEEGGAEEGEDREPVRPTATLDFSQGPVLIRTRGGSATVMHGGRTLGRTPVRVQLPVGTQRLRLVPSGGGEPQTVTVDVQWGELTAVDVDLSGSAFGNPY